MIPDGQLSQNLPNPVRTLASILHYQLKNETSIKISITASSKLFGTQEKPLHQALKGVHYESGHKNADERMQLMISRRTPPPVREWMTMMMMRMKVLLLE